MELKITVKNVIYETSTNKFDWRQVQVIQYSVGILREIR